MKDIWTVTIRQSLRYEEEVVAHFKKVEDAKTFALYALNGCEKVHVFISYEASNEPEEKEVEQ